MYGIEPDWFTRDEYRDPRECTCFCGTIFTSHARDLQFIDMRQSKDEHGGLKVDNKTGQKIMENVVVLGNLSLKSCPDCGTNRIKSFKVLPKMAVKT